MRMIVTEYEYEIRRMSTILDIEFSNRVKQGTRRQSGFNKFREYIKCGPGKNCKAIVDPHGGNYT